MKNNNNKTQKRMFDIPEKIGNRNRYNVGSTWKLLIKKCDITHMR